MVQFKYKPIENSNNHGGTRPHKNIKYIVIHYTANTSSGANAMAHYKYFNRKTTYTSAHYFVDNHNIIQIVGDGTVAYSVGDNQGYGRYLNGCRNENSISIEMCVNSDEDFNITLFNTIELVKNLLAKYPHAIVCRHYDVSRKHCPAMLLNKRAWSKFLNDIKAPRKLIIDLSKDSTAKLVGNKPTPVQGRTKPQKEGGYSVKTNTPHDVLNVREGPTVNSRIVSSYRDTSVIYVHEVIHTNRGTWYKIEYKQGKFGYVSARYCVGIK